MLNKEEIIFNTTSLITAWLDGKKDVGPMVVEMWNKDYVDGFPCTIENCGEVAGEQLFNNNGKFHKLRLVGTVDGKSDTVIGEIEIKFKWQE